MKHNNYSDVSKTLKILFKKINKIGFKERDINTPKFVKTFRAKLLQKLNNCTGVQTIIHCCIVSVGGERERER